MYISIPRSAEKSAYRTFQRSLNREFLEFYLATSMRFYSEARSARNAQCVSSRSTNKQSNFCVVAFATCFFDYLFWHSFD